MNTYDKTQDKLKLIDAMLQRLDSRAFKIKLDSNFENTTDHLNNDLDEIYSQLLVVDSKLNNISLK